MTENRRILSVSAALFLLLAGPPAAAAVPGHPLVSPRAKAAVNPSGQEIAILKAINAIRVRNGRRPLSLGRALYRAARSHSVDMARRGYFDHGAIPQRLRHFGVRGRTVGENIAYANESEFSADVVLQMWMTSPSHRAVLLDRSFKRVGVGVAGGATRLVTADFAG
jgi:uncharacterized protein YkwD